MIDFLGDVDDGFAAPNETFCKVRLVVGLFLEDEAGEEGDDLFGLEAECSLAIVPEFAMGYSLRQDILQNQLGEHQFVRRMNLACHLALELHSRVTVNELQILQDFCSLLVVR
jgi:hypothetical protein